MPYFPQVSDLCMGLYEPLIHPKFSLYSADGTQTYLIEANLVQSTEQIGRTTDHLLGGDICECAKFVLRI